MAVKSVGPASRPGSRHWRPTLQRGIDAVSEYADVAAQKLGAELHTECISQIGITRNGNTLRPTTPYNVTHYIHRVLPTRCVAEASAVSRRARSRRPLASGGRWGVLEAAGSGR